MYEISCGEGKHKICLKLEQTHEGWIGSLTGGEKPHVGGVILAVPRPSLTGSGLSCDMWTIPVPGHLDHEAAAPLTRQLCVKLGVPISMTCGIHIKKASTADISLIKENCHKLTEEILGLLK